MPDEEKRSSFGILWEEVKKKWQEEEGNFWKKLRGVYLHYRSLQEKKEENEGIYKELYEGSLLRGSFLVLLVSSSVIATLGLLMDSTAVIIGAMLIAPLMVPILGFSLAVIWGDKKFLWNSILSLGVGSIFVFLVGYLVARYVPGVEMTPAIEARINPSLTDIFIALFSGIVAAYAYVKPGIDSSISGVAIAVALLPPLATAGIVYALGKKEAFLGASLLYLTNLTGIAISSGLIFWKMGIHPPYEKEEEVSKRAKANLLLTSFMLFLLAFPLGFFSWESYRIKKKKEEIFKWIKKEFPSGEIQEGELLKFPQGLFLKITLLLDREISQEEKKELLRKLQENYPSLYKVRIFFLKGDLLEGDF